jgi:hypothetical protein
LGGESFEASSVGGTTDLLRDDRAASYPAALPLIAGIEGMIIEDFGVDAAEPGANANGTSTAVLPDEVEEVESVFFSVVTHPLFSISFLGEGISEANSILSFVWALRLRKKNAARANAESTRRHAMTMPAMAPPESPAFPC